MTLDDGRPAAGRYVVPRCGARAPHALSLEPVRAP